MEGVVQQHTLTLHMNVDRAESIRRGYGADPVQTVTLNLSQLTDEQRTAVADRLGRRAMYGSSGGDHDTLIKRGSFTSTLRIQEPTMAGVLAAIEADDAHHQQKQAKERQQRAWQAQQEAERRAKAEQQEQQRQAVLAKLAAAGEDDEVLAKVASGLTPGERSLLEGYRTERWVGEAMIYENRLKARRWRIEEAREEQQRQERETQRHERAAWIEAHGSPRLRRLLAEEIEHEAVYRDERLALERPGWRWDTITGTQQHEPRNAPDSALDLLDEARKLAPDARLVYWTVDEAPDDEYEDVSRVAVRGYTCEAKFMGSTIVFRVDEDGTPPVVLEGDED